MPKRTLSLSWVNHVATAWMILAAVFTLASSAAVVVGILAAEGPRADENVLIWLSLLLGFTVAMVGVALVGLLARAVVRNGRAIDAAAHSAAEGRRRLESIFEAVHESQQRLIELSQMSDAAKSLLYHQQEVSTIHGLLHEALVGQDYAWAESLVDGIETRLGYSQEAEQMRREIAAARSSSAEQKVDSAIEHVTKHVEARNWTQAIRQSERLRKALPDNPRIAALEQVIREARARHKRQLLKDYGEAVRVSNIDRSIELLRELDGYLTPQEAAALEESARGVFKAKLHNLGVQFAICVTDERWDTAIVVGEQIVSEYPNSRMAQEVEEKLDQLRARAAAVREAQAAAENA